MEFFLNAHSDEKKLGNNLIFARNPFAKNPLPKDFWGIGREWFLKDNKIGHIDYDSDNDEPYV